MTENSRKVLETLKAHYAEGKQWETAELAAEAGVSSPTVTGAVTGMCKKGFAERIPGVKEVKIVKDGVEEVKEKEIKYIKLTEAGYNFDPDAAVESK